MFLVQITDCVQMEEIWHSLFFYSDDEKKFS